VPMCLLQPALEIVYFGSLLRQPFEGLPVLNGAVGKAYFFLAWGLVVAIAPLIMVLSKRDSVVFLLLGLPVVGVCGAVVLLLPAEIWPHVWVVLLLGFVLALVLLTKNRKSRFLDFQPRVSAYMFAESLVIFAISWICASALQFSRVVSSINTFSAPIAVYWLLWMMFFAFISLITSE